MNGKRLGAGLAGLVAILAGGAYYCMTRKRRKMAEGEEPEAVDTGVMYDKDDLVFEADGEALPPTDKLSEISIDCAGMRISLNTKGFWRASANGVSTNGYEVDWWPECWPGVNYRILVVNTNDAERRNGIYYWLFFIQEKNCKQSYFSWANLERNGHEIIYPDYIVALGDNLDLTFIMAKDEFGSSSQCFDKHGCRAAVYISRPDNRDETTARDIMFFGEDEPSKIVLYDALNGKACTGDIGMSNLIGYIVDMQSKLTSNNNIICLCRMENEKNGRFYAYWRVGRPGCGNRPVFYRDKVSEFNPDRFMRACLENDGQVPTAYYEKIDYMEVCGSK